MCAKHKAFFRQLLSKWKNDLIDQNKELYLENSMISRRHSRPQLIQVKQLR